MPNITPDISCKKLAGMIDHTLLSATAVHEQIGQLCQEAVRYGFCGVCVNSRWVSFAADKLRGSGVKIVSVAGFPLGADSTQIKLAQAKEVIFAGADEVDMVADLAAIIEGDGKYLTEQLKAVCGLCHSMRPGVLLKVIIESAALNAEQKRFICGICSEVGVDFVKTSTGLHPAGGASCDDVRLMKVAAGRCKVKAAGGIRTAEQVIEMLDAGADRIGCSVSVEIMEQFSSEHGQ